MLTGQRRSKHCLHPRIPKDTEASCAVGNRGVLLNTIPVVESEAGCAPSDALDVGLISYFLGEKESDSSL